LASPYSSYPLNSGLVLTALLALVPLLTAGVSIYLSNRPVGTPSCHELSIPLDQADQKRALPADPVLLLGSTRVERWQSPPRRLGNDTLLANPVHGLRPELVANCFPRMVAHYQPRTTIILLETEDAIDNPGATLRSLEDIRRQREYFAVSPRLIVIAPLLTPRNTQSYQAFADFGEQLETWSRTSAGVESFDISDRFSHDGITPNPHLFWPDGRTLSREGYRRLADTLAELLDSISSTD